MSLYWDRAGVIACNDHAPLRDKVRWLAENWKEITPATAAGAGMKCAVCGRRAEAVQKKRRAVMAVYTQVNKDLCRARGWSRRDPTDAPLFAERKP